MKAFLAVLACLVSLMGCTSKKSLVVLMPDPDGKVGRVTVSNPQGKQVLTEAYAATEIREKQPPGPIRFLSEKEVEATFGKALNATPRAPVSFILHFLTGTVSLSETSLQHLKKIQDEVKKRIPGDVYIAGHTDTVGKKEDNARLSLERAQIVRDELVKIGVDPALIQVFAHGENDPLIHTEDEVDEPRNRRVEVFIR